MPIIVNLDVQLAKRKVRLKDLAAMVGISIQNLSTLKTNRAKAIRFSTLEKICKALDCLPGDILDFQPDEDQTRRPNHVVRTSGDSVVVSRDQ